MSSAAAIKHRRSIWRAGAAMVCGGLILLSAGCSSGDSTTDQGSNDSDTGLTAQKITEAIEPDGFECAEEDPRLDGREEMVECKGDDYVVITATRFADADERKEQSVTIKNVLCKNRDTLGIDTMRSAVSDSWMLVPGGDDDKNIAAFDKAMTTLGLDWNEDPC